MMRTHYQNQITPELNGKNVKIAGWVHEIRDLGAILFVLIRDKTGISQTVVKKKTASHALVAAVQSLVKETAVVVSGVVKASKQAPGGFEIVPDSLVIVGEVYKKVPLDVTGKVPAELDTRLDARFIDLRRIEPAAIFRIRAQAQRAFRDKLLEQSFQEINPPTIVSASTEGGSDLFHVQYFEKDAFLAQSPQLYKQLAVLGGLDKVFMTMPVFRAEKHNTVSHLNEVTQMDAEMGFATDQDALDVLEKVFLHILSSVKENCQYELAILEQDLTVHTKLKRFTYDDVLTALSGKYKDLSWGQDFSKEMEWVMPELLGTDAFFITDWPTQVRAFYSMPHENEPKKCKAYDLMYRGIELASGAQRIHIPDLLISALKNRGLDPDDFESYIDAFRYGAVPHAGWSIGSERLTMQLCGQKNIRECALFPRDRHRLLP